MVGTRNLAQPGVAAAASGVGVVHACPLHAEAGSLGEVVGAWVRGMFIIEILDFGCHWKP